MNNRPGLRALASRRRGGFAALLALVVSALPVSAAVPTPDTRFSPAAGPVDVVFLDDDGIRVGGEFDEIGAPTGLAAALDPGTGQVFAAIPPVEGLFDICAVWALAPDGLGGWFIGGWFHTVGGLPRQNVAHILADGTVSDWNPFSGVSPGSYVPTLAIEVVGNTVYIGGWFTQVAGETRNRVAAFTVDTGELLPWDPDANAKVTDLQWHDGVLFAGGEFQTIGGATRNGLAALDPVTGLATTWDPGVHAYRMALGDGVLYVGGDDGVRAVDPVSGAFLPFQVDLNGGFSAIALGEGVVYLSGGFTLVNGVARRKLAAVDATTGEPTPWNPNPGLGYYSWAFHSIAVGGDTVYLGGLFLDIAGRDRRYLTAVDAVTGELLPDVLGTNNTVFAIAVDGSTLAAGGRFSVVRPFDRRHAATYSWNGFVLKWKAQADFDVRAVARGGLDLAARARFGDLIYLGGAFSTIGAVNRRGLAAVDAISGAVYPWNPNVEVGLPGTGYGAVHSIAVGNGLIYYGGTFLHVGGLPLRYLAASPPGPTGGEPTAWAPEPDDDVFAIAFPPDESVLYAGGAFLSMGGTARSHLAALDPASGAATPWTPDPDGAVRAVLPAGSVVYVGGDFLAVGPDARAHVAAIDAATGLATPWQADADGVVRALAMGDGVLYVGGDFDTIAGEPRGRLAAIDLVTGEALPWDPQIEGVVRSVAYRDGVVYVGGDFSSAAGIRREHFAVLSGATNSPVAASALPVASGALALQPVAPHPLHGDGSVTFVLPREEAVDLTLHDVAGRRVRTLLHGERMTAGPHTVPIRTDGLAGGVYFLRLDAAGERRSTKVVVPGR